MRLVVDEEVPYRFGKARGKDTLKKSFDIVICEDSQACLAGVRNATLSEMYKHVDVKGQLPVDDVRKRDLHVEYVLSEEMVAGVLTKNLHDHKLESLLALFEMS